MGVTNIQMLNIIILLFIGITVARKCNSPIELSVVVDASDSLSARKTTFVKTFLNKIASFFQLSAFSSHVSVVLAGSDVRIVIELNKHGADRLKFREAVDKAVKPLGGEWSVNRGLQMIKKRVFTEEKGMRPFLPRIVLVVTSGKPGNGNDIQHQIKNLNDIGAKVYIVSVGDVARRDKIMRMIKNESSEIVKVHLNNFGELTSLASVIGEDICQKDYHDELAVCKAKVDVGFIIDSSRSISYEGYKKMQTFMKAISVYLGFAPDALHVGAVLYSKEAKLWTRFKEIVNLRKWFKKLWRMSHYRGVTRIDLGLDVANTQLFTRKSGMRDDAIKIAILFTDGEQTTRGIDDLIPLREAADKLRERDITVFAVGIGKSVRKDQLLEIANTSEYMIILSSFNELKAKTRKVARDVCQLVIDPPIVSFTEPLYTAMDSQNVTVGVSISNNKRKTPITIRIIPKSVTAKSNDFDDSIKVIIFQPGENGQKFVQIGLVNDEDYEPTEEFTISLASNSSVILRNSSKIQILNDDSPQLIEFNRPVYEVLESEKAVVGISITKGKISQPLTVRIIPKSGTASNKDFNANVKEVKFQPGEFGPKFVDIGLLNDKEVEPEEEFYLSLSSSSIIARGNRSIVRILDDDFYPLPVIEFTQSDYNASEGENAVVGISVAEGNIIRPLTVRIIPKSQSAGENDFENVPQEVTFQPGETGPKFVDIDLINDWDVEPIEEFTVFLTSNSSAILGNSSSVNIHDDDATCRRMDIGFLLDSTASMRNCNFKKEKKFVKDIVSYFHISQEFTRVSTIQYGASNVLTRKFNETKSLKDFQGQIDSLKLKGGSARLGEALYLAASSMFTAESGMRPYVPKILVVLSDGSETVFTQFAQEISSLLDKNKVRVIAVGVGEADEKTLAQFVSSPKDLIMVDKFQDATENLVALLNRACISGSDPGKCQVTKKLLPNVKIGGCVSGKPVEIGVCGGHCLSKFINYNGLYKIKCACCKVKESVTIPVELHCNLDKRQTFKISSAVSCSCASCTEKHIGVH